MQKCSLFSLRIRINMFMKDQYAELRKVILKLLNIFKYISPVKIIDYCKC